MVINAVKPAYDKEANVNPEMLEYFDTDFCEIIIDSSEIYNLGEPRPAINGTFVGNVITTGSNSKPDSSCENSCQESQDRPLSTKQPEVDNDLNIVNSVEKEKIRGKCGSKSKRRPFSARKRGIDSEVNVIKSEEKENIRGRRGSKSRKLVSTKKSRINNKVNIAKPVGKENVLSTIDVEENEIKNSREKRKSRLVKKENNSSANVSLENEDIDQAMKEKPTNDEGLTNTTKRVGRRRGKLFKKYVFYGGLYHCESCTFETKYYCSVRTHVKFQHGEVSMMTCGKCSFQTKWPVTYKRHVATAHIESKETNQAKNKRKGKTCDVVFHCKYCSYQTKNRKILKSHEMTRHLQNFCDQCDFKTRWVTHLKVHREVAHGEEQTLNCEECNFQTKWRHSLKKHRSQIHGDSTCTASCELCSYQTLQWADLRKHYHTVHRLGKMLMCQQCDFKTRYKQSLELHVGRKHGQQETFNCYLCTFSASSKTTLASHIDKAHTYGDFIFLTCKMCRFETRYIPLLEAHLNVCAALK